MIERGGKYTGQIDMESRSGVRSGGNPLRCIYVPVARRYPDSEGKEGPNAVRNLMPHRETGVRAIFEAPRFIIQRPSGIRHDFPSGNRLVIEFLSPGSLEAVYTTTCRRARANLRARPRNALVKHVRCGISIRAKYMGAYTSTTKFVKFEMGHQAMYRVHIANLITILAESEGTDRRVLRYYRKEADELLAIYKVSANYLIF